MGAIPNTSEMPDGSLQKVKNTPDIFAEQGT